MLGLLCLPKVGKQNLAKDSSAELYFLDVFSLIHGCYDGDWAHWLAHVHIHSQVKFEVLIVIVFKTKSVILKKVLVRLPAVAVPSLLTFFEWPSHTIEKAKVNLRTVRVALKILFERLGCNDVSFAHFLIELD